MQGHALVVEHVLEPAAGHRARAVGAHLDDEPGHDRRQVIALREEGVGPVLGGEERLGHEAIVAERRGRYAPGVDAIRPDPERQQRPQVRVRAAASTSGGGRVRTALRCPYCHDQVTRRGALSCARPACGALYHRECWDEVAAWDGCAALGCGGREAREVSGLGYLVRVARLLAAALLFPRRVVRALRVTEGAGPRAVFGQALDRAWVVVPSRDSSKNGLLKLALHAVVVGPVLGVLVALVVWSGLTAPGPILVIFPLLAVLGTLGAAFGLALLATLALFSARALARAFRRELAAFGRADAPVRSPLEPTDK